MRLAGRCSGTKRTEIMPRSKSSRPAESIERRQVLKALAALGLSALPGRALADHPAMAASGGEFCGAGPGGKPLFIPGVSGAFGRFAPGSRPFTLRAGAAAKAAPWTLTYTVESSGKHFVNPT